LSQYCEIAVNFPGQNSVLTYKHSIELARGDLVEIPLGRRKEVGCVLSSELKEESLVNLNTKIKYKEVIKKIDSAFTLDENELELFKWMSSYYHYPLGKLIFDCLPKLMKRPRPLDSFRGKGVKDHFEFTGEQEEAYKRIKVSLGTGFSKWLLHGITGSGKSIVYLKLMKDVLASGNSVLYLLPEINLTSQFLDFFTTYLDVPVYTYNSEISNSNKFLLWKTLYEDHSPKLVLGVRSSVFLPIKKLGLILIDEEHDNSFKQDSRCAYNARDVAIKKASLQKLPVVLGSATPSFETYFQFRMGASQSNYVRLENRVGEGKPPAIEIIKSTLEEIDSSIWPFQSESLSAVDSAVKKGEQAIVFVNRLGFASFIQCMGCGKEFNCLNCSSKLKFFKRKRKLSCSHCEFEIDLPSECPECSCLTLESKGFGTEKVVAILKEQFPNYTIGRFDRDEVTTFNKMEEVLNNFHAGKIDILVGTQMLSKGHNFKKVNTVVVLGADNQLNFPDFRAFEKVFQLVTQVAGRAGRYSNSGRVLIQSFNPDLPLWSSVKKTDYDGFFAEEIKTREVFCDPPYSKVALLYFIGTNPSRVQEDATGAAALLRKMCEEHFSKVEILGPKPASIEKKSNKYYWCLQIKSSDLNQLHNLINSFFNNIRRFRSQVKLDVDPQVYQ
jgi:primosomal protein N' (replication factor Y) (superfamily II helicase)